MSHIEIAQGHAVEILGRPLTAAVADLLARILGHEGIPVELSTDANGVVQLFPLRVFTTAEEVATHRAITAVTDSRIAWHERWPA